MSTRDPASMATAPGDSVCMGSGRLAFSSHTFALTRCGVDIYTYISTLQVYFPRYYRYAVDVIVIDKVRFTIDTSSAWFTVDHQLNLAPRTPGPQISNMRAAQDDPERREGA